MDFFQTLRKIIKYRLIIPPLQLPDHLIPLLMASKEESLTLQKISDLVERVNYLEEQNLKSRKALDTALLQNKHLEKCIENLGMFCMAVEPM